MTRSFDLTRRAALASGVSLVMMAHAARADDGLAKKKLVVIIARGGMDGLSVSPPIGDNAYRSLRGQIAIPADQALKLDSDFALHPKLVAIHALALKGQARIAPSVATPDRARSHFEAQDVLESGMVQVYSSSSGWLNRTLGALQARHVEAMSVGSQAPLLLRGPIQAASWSPGRTPQGDRLPMLLSDLYRDDPLLSKAFASGLEISSMAQQATSGGDMTAQGLGPQGPAAVEASRQMGKTVAGFMIQPRGPQIVGLSLDGWDTHANQGAAEGQLANRLANLDALIDGMAIGLGSEWNNTVVVVATEFGRTAHVNGTGGTDHGTASTALVMGGALKKGGIIGDWPTLQSAKLFENRDLAPTLDMRGLFKGVLAEHLGVDRRALDTSIFPDTAGIAPAMNLV
jgi:uncharacterized protein (DUF1501 family)